MAERADQLFVDFRRSGDPSLLAEVFDLCAYDLFKVAMHLCPTDGEAEDLVQETFLAALEHAGRYRAGESVRAWLLGILRNRARELRRTTSRSPEAERLHERRFSGPGELLLQGEFHEAFEAALARIPGTYREVLELRLRDELAASEIAERLERSPGTVRTQIYRALQLLRAALPASAAALITSQTHTRGLDTIRAHVLEQAGLLHRATWALPTLLAMKKTIALACALLLVAASGWYAPLDRSTPQPEVTSPSAAPAPGAAAGDTVLAAASPEEEVEPDREAATAATPTPAPDEAEAPASTPEGWPFLVPPYEVTIQVVDQRLEPVVGATVTVYEGRLSVPRERKGGSIGADLSDPSQRAYTGRETDADPVVQEVTGGLGSCVLSLDREVCYVAAEHPDLGSSLDTALRRADDGETVQLLLRPTTRVTGKVTDGRGAPVPDALVRSWTMGGDFDSGTTPNLRARTDNEGVYELFLTANVYYGLAASSEGRSSDHVELDAGSQGGTRQVDFTLPGAFRVLGIVLGPDGEPAGAGSVRASLVEGGRGRSGPIRGEAPGRGRFEVLLTDPGEYLVTARAPGHAASESVRVVLGEGLPFPDVTLRLLEKSFMQGRVLDPEGRPVPDLELTVFDQRPGSTAWARQQGQESTRVLRTDEAGAFRVDDCDPSSAYTIHFQVHPEVPTLRQFVRDVPGDRKDIEIRLDPELLDTTSVSGRVLDGTTGEPVETFEVTLRELMENGYSTRPLHGDLREVLPRQGCALVPRMAPSESHSGTVFSLPRPPDRLADPRTGPLPPPRT